MIVSITTFLKTPLSSESESQNWERIVDLDQKLYKCFKQVSQFETKLSQLWESQVIGKTIEGKLTSQF